MHSSDHNSGLAIGLRAEWVHPRRVGLGVAHNDVLLRLLDCIGALGEDEKLVDKADDQRHQREEGHDRCGHTRGWNRRHHDIDDQHCHQDDGSGAHSRPGQIDERNAHNGTHTPHSRPQRSRHQISPGPAHSEGRKPQRPKKRPVQTDEHHKLYGSAADVPRHTRPLFDGELTPRSQDRHAQRGDRVEAKVIKIRQRRHVHLSMQLQLLLGVPQQIQNGKRLARVEKRRHAQHRRTDLAALHVEECRCDAAEARDTEESRVDGLPRHRLEDGIDGAAGEQQ
mmetsp:Transcript_2311/g.5248  ORF Transcript_2311/g.5248 Transcript_2311/m.5248 type:complete len:281 (+) Transcript_2311:1455-2297(+)